VIRPEEAELISETRLGRVLIDEVAARRGVDPAVLRMRRRRAEMAVVAALREGLLDGVALTSKPGRSRTAQTIQSSAHHRPNGQ
jgi:hypothetical protein